MRECALCTGACPNSAVAAFDHLCGAAHQRNVVQLYPELAGLLPKRQDDGASGAVSVKELAELLGNGEYRRVHEKLGCNVDAVLRSAQQEHDRRERAQQLLREVHSVPGESDWLRVEARHIVGWDDTIFDNVIVPLEQSPPLDDLIRRCKFGATPNCARVPTVVPAFLPAFKESRAATLKARHDHPCAVAGVRLAVAATVASSESGSPQLAADLDATRFDLICGTSFLKAISGDGHLTKHEYYLQRMRAGTGGGPLCVLHMPGAKHSDGTAGHAVERLLCGDGASGCCFALTSVCIPKLGDAGVWRALVCSEVDAVDEHNRLVEIKSSEKKRGMEFVCKKVALQVRVNGSQGVLGCHIQGGGEGQGRGKLTSVEWLSVDSFQHGEAFVQQGRSARLMLDRVMTGAHAAEQEASEGVLHLVFDDIKAPVVRPAARGCGVRVLPEAVV